MQPRLIENVISSNELFFMYKQICETNLWSITGITDNAPDVYNKKFNHSPMLLVKRDNEIRSYPFYIWGKSLLFRMEDKLKKDNIGIPIKINRMWFNITYTENNQHWLHIDYKTEDSVSFVFFLTPIWSPTWQGSFFVDGKKYEFVLGNAVAYNSNEYHRGDIPSENSKPWLRLTCNIVAERE